MDGDLVTLRTYSTEAEAGLAASVLEANGIPARVVADTAGGAIPALTVLFPVKLVVRSSDADEARDLLESSIDDDGTDEVEDDERD